MSVGIGFGRGDTLCERRAGGIRHGRGLIEGLGAEQVLEVELRSIESRGGAGLLVPGQRHGGRDVEIERQLEGQ